MPPIFVVVNPAAGGGRCGRRAKAVLAELERHGLELVVVETSRPGDGIVLSRQAFADGHRSFLAVGGDGTAGEVLNGVFPQSLDLGQPATLGLLPLGTGNSFTRQFGNHGARRARRAVLGGRRQRCDVLRFSHAGGVTYSMNMIAVGFAANVAARVNRSLKPFGVLGYTLGVLLELWHLKPTRIRLELDGEAQPAHDRSFVCFQNSRHTGGGMLMAPHAEVDDGLVDVIDVDAASRGTLLLALPRLYFGTHLSHPAVHAGTARVVEIQQASPMNVLVDGEVMTTAPQRIEVLPAAIDVMV